MKVQITLEVTPLSFTREDYELLTKGYDEEDYEHEMFEGNPGHSGLGDYVSLMITTNDAACLNVLGGNLISVRRSGVK